MMRPSTAFGLVAIACAACMLDFPGLRPGADGGSVARPVPAQIHSSAADLIIGGKLFAGETNLWVDAQIDEVRLSNVARSAAWIATHHLAMTGGFVTFGAEEGL
jgi:hypothetical protein